MSPAQSTRAYGGVAAAERMAIRRAALIDAAIQSMAESGLAGTSVRSVCARARLTARYFYEAFTDLDELLVAALGSVTGEVEAASLRALDTVPVDDTAAQVRAAIDAGYGVVATDAVKANMLVVAVAGNAALRKRREQFVDDFTDIVIANLPVLRALTVAERHKARVVVLFLMAGSIELIVAVLESRVRLSRRALVDRLTSLWLAALAAA